MTESPDVLAAWRAHTVATLAEHLAGAVAHLLPDGHEILATGTHLVLTRRSGSGPARTVVTHQMDPHPPGVAYETTARRMLDDLQDMVVGSLHRPWPEADAGLYPWAHEQDGRVDLAFADRDGQPRLSLASFPVPPEPERVVGAG